jgi:hypothetical protein
MFCDTLGCIDYTSATPVTSKYLPAQPTILAEAVPGIEEEYPCTSRSSVIRIIQKGLVWCCERGGIAIIGSFCGLLIPLGGFGSLHTIPSRALLEYIMIKDYS